MKKELKLRFMRETGKTVKTAADDRIVVWSDEYVEWLEGKAMKTITEQEDEPYCRLYIEEYSEMERVCEGCMGPCGQCDEINIVNQSPESDRLEFAGVELITKS